MSALALIQATVEPAVRDYAVNFITFDVMRGSPSWAAAVFRKEKAKAGALGYAICSIFKKHGIRLPPMADSPRKDRGSNNWYILPGVPSIPAAVLPKIANDLEAHFKQHPSTTPFDRYVWMRLVRTGEDVCATVEPTGMPGVEDTIQRAADWWSDDKLFAVKTQHFGEVRLEDANDQSLMFDIMRGPFAGVTLFLSDRHGLRLMIDMSRLDAQPVVENVWADMRLQRAAQHGVSAFRTELGACFDRNFAKIEAVIREERR